MRSESDAAGLVDGDVLYLLMRQAKACDLPIIRERLSAKQVAVEPVDGEDIGHELDAPNRHDGPQILVCTQGAVTLRGKSDALHLERGASAWVAADDGPIRLEAAEPSALFRATVGPPAL